jgi:hypothetical protein
MIPRYSMRGLCLPVRRRFLQFASNEHEKDDMHVISEALPLVYAADGQRNDTSSDICVAGTSQDRIVRWFFVTTAALARFEFRVYSIRRKSNCLLPGLVGT